MELTEAEARIYEAIKSAGQVTTEAITTALEYRSNAGSLYILKKLEEKGAIQRHTGEGRGLEWSVTSSEEEPTSTVIEEPPSPQFEDKLEEYVALSNEYSEMREHLSTLEARLRSLRNEILPGKPTLKLAHSNDGGNGPAAA